MLRKPGLQHLALLGCDLRSPADHLVDRIRPAGQREFLRGDDVRVVTDHAAALQHVGARSRGQLLTAGNLTPENQNQWNPTEPNPWNLWNPWNPWNHIHFTSMRTESY